MVRRYGFKAVILGVIMLQFGHRYREVADSGIVQRHMKAV